MNQFSQNIRSDPHSGTDNIESTLSVPGIPEMQGSTVLSESVRNRDTKVPGIGIRIKFCTSLNLSIGLGIEFFYFWVPNSINWDIYIYSNL